MKYLVRSVKYFFYLMVILALIIAALIALKMVGPDISQIFVNGYDSLWQIALLMAVFAALYPRFGFSTRTARVLGSDEEVVPHVIRVMNEHGYRLENRDGADMTFRKKSTLSRVFKMCEDRLTFTRRASGFDIEGLTRDLSRVVAAVEPNEY